MEGGVHPGDFKGGKGYPYGFGWAVDEAGGQPHHHHDGVWQGFTAHIPHYLGDDLSVIVLTNLSGSDPGGIARQIAGLYNPKLLPTDPPKDKK